LLFSLFRHVHIFFVFRVRCITNKMALSKRLRQTKSAHSTKPRKLLVRKRTSKRTLTKKKTDPRTKGRKLAKTMKAQRALKRPIVKRVSCATAAAKVGPKTAKTSQKQNKITAPKPAKSQLSTLLCAWCTNAHKRNLFHVRKGLSLVSSFACIKCRMLPGVQVCCVSCGSTAAACPKGVCLPCTKKRNINVFQWIKPVSLA